MLKLRRVTLGQLVTVVTEICGLESVSNLIAFFGIDVAMVTIDIVDVLNQVQFLVWILKVFLKKILKDFLSITAKSL